MRLAVPTADSAFVVTRDDDPTHARPAAASCAELDASAGDRYYRDLASGLLYVEAIAAPGRADVTFRIDPR